jgi:hypothetical protein
VRHASGTPLNPAQGEGKGREGKGKEGEESIALSIPDWIPQQTWMAFEQMRKRINKPLTDEATRRILVRLDKWRSDGQSVEEILSMSIENNWQGLWPIEKKNGGGNGEGKNHRSAQGHGDIEGCKTGSAYFDSLLEPLGTT